MGRPFPVPGGRVTDIPVSGDANVLFLVNMGSGDLKLSMMTDVATSPMATVGANSPGTLVITEPQGKIFAWAATDLNIWYDELHTQDPAPLLLGQIMSGLLKQQGFAVSMSDGSLATLGKTTDPAVTNPALAMTAMQAYKGLLQLLSGVLGADVTDRMARLLGHVIVDGLPAADITDRVARVLGHVIVDSLPAADVTDRAARLLGKTGVQVAGADVTKANPVPVANAGSSLWKPGTAVANTQVVVTIAFVAGQSVRIRSISAGFSGAAPAAPVQLTAADGTTTASWAVNQNGLCEDFVNGIAFAVGAVVTITLPAGGAGAIGNVLVEYDQF